MQSGGNNSAALMTASAVEAAALTSASAAEAQVGYPLAERLFDTTITIVLLPVILIVGAMIALAIYLDSPGPVTYRSRRIGTDGEAFEMLKFRKMRRDASSDPVTLDDDARFTPIGRFLAATRLDELPQVWNVLRGEMRLVGPRPELECFVQQYPVEYSEILTVAPGITGNAQLRFLDERHLLQGADPATLYSTHVLPLKIEIDLDYTRHHSLIGDLTILVRTLALPVTLTAAKMRQRHAILRTWLFATASATLLALMFVVASTHLA